MSDPATGTVIERLNAVARDLGPIPKRRIDIGKGFNAFNAFLVDDVYAHVGPLFAKHGIVVVPQFRSAEYSAVESARGTKGTVAHVVIDYEFHGVDGSSVTMTFAAEGIDYQDKATNKAAQQALKYGIIQLLQIATGEVDPDAAELPETSIEAPSTSGAGEPMSPDRRARNAAWHLKQPDEDAAIALFTKAMVAAGCDLAAELTDTDADKVIALMDGLVNQ